MIKEPVELKCLHRHCDYILLIDGDKIYKEDFEVICPTCGFIYTFKDGGMYVKTHYPINIGIETKRSLISY